VARDGEFEFADPGFAGMLGAVVELEGKRNAPVGIEFVDIQMQAAHQPDVVAGVSFDVLFAPVIAPRVQRGAVVGEAQKAPLRHGFAREVGIGAGGIGGNGVVVGAFERRAVEGGFRAIAEIGKQQGYPAPETVGGRATSPRRPVGGGGAVGGAIRGGEGVAVGAIGHECRVDAAQILLADGDIGAFDGFAVVRAGNGGQDADDGHSDQQFDKGKGSVVQGVSSYAKPGWGGETG
jgi:hypothetical protein